NPLAGVQRFTYDAAGNITSVRDARGVVFIRNTYDAKGRVIQQTQAPRAAAGNPGTVGFPATTVSTPTWTFQYTDRADGTIAKTRVTDPRGMVSDIEFDNEGFVVKQTDAVGTPNERVTTTERDYAHRVTATVDGNNHREEFTYDSAGRVTQFKAGVG